MLVLIISIHIYIYIYIHTVASKVYCSLYNNYQILWSIYTRGVFVSMIVLHRSTVVLLLDCMR